MHAHAQLQFWVWPLVVPVLGLQRLGAGPSGIHTQGWKKQKKHMFLPFLGLAVNCLVGTIAVTVQASSTDSAQTQCKYSALAAQPPVHTQYIGSTAPQYNHTAMAVQLPVQTQYIGSTAP